MGSVAVISPHCPKVVLPVFFRVVALAPEVCDRQNISSRPGSPDHHLDSSLENCRSHVAPLFALLMPIGERLDSEPSEYRSPVLRVGYTTLEYKPLSSTERQMYQLPVPLDGSPTLG